MGLVPRPALLTWSPRREVRHEAGVVHGIFCESKRAFRGEGDLDVAMFEVVSIQGEPLFARQHGVTDVVC